MQRTIKVWYKQTGVKRVMREAAKRPAWLVTLDGKPLVTPAKAPLELPTEPLAWAVALEWQSQGKLLQPYTMPLTKLASTSIDQLSSIRPVMQDSMLRTMQTDVACIRADPAEQPELCAKEAEAYDALLAWLEEREGLRLLASSSLTVAHPPESLQTARSLLDSFDGWTIAALDSLSGTTKSLVLALAVLRGRLGAEQACVAARVAEQHQIDEWGEVEAGHDLDKADLQVRVSAASAFLRMLPPLGTLERAEL